MRVRENISNKFAFFFFLISIIILIFFLANITPGLKGSLDQELRILLKQNEKILDNSIKVSVKNLYNSFRYWNSNEIKYNSLKIDISYKNFKILKEERKKALKLKYNLSRKKIPIQITFKNKTYKASARLKGGLSDHYGNNKQFSLMIKLKNNESINGMSEFALTQHAPRQYPNNVFYSKLLSSANLYMPKFITYKIILNGDDWGLMLAEEHYSNFYYELRNKPYFPTVKFTNEDNSDLRRVFLSEFNSNVDFKVYDFLEFRHGKLENRIFNKNDFNDLKFDNLKSNLKDIKYSLVKDKVDVSEFDQIFDMNKLSKVFILAIITGDYHALGYRNIRFYYNTETKRLDPIPTDWGLNLRKINSEKQIENELINLINCVHSNCTYHHHTIYDKIIKNKVFQKYFIDNLSLFAKNIENNKENVKELCRFQNNCMGKMNYNVLLENLVFLKNEIGYIEVLNKIFSNKKDYQKAPQIEVEKTVKKKYFEIVNNAVYIRAFSNGKLKIINLTPFPIKISSIKLLKKNCLQDNVKNEINNECYLFIDKNIALSVTNLEFFEYNLNKNLSNFEKIIVYSEHQGIQLNPSMFDIENQNYLKLIKLKKDNQIG